MAYQPFSTAPKFVQQISIDPASIAGNSIVTQTFSLPGVEPGMFLNVEILDIDSSVWVLGARCPTRGTLEVAFMNFSASPVDMSTVTANVLGL